MKRITKIVALALTFAITLSVSGCKKTTGSDLLKPGYKYNPYNGEYYAYDDYDGYSGSKRNNSSNASGSSVGGNKNNNNSSESTGVNKDSSSANSSGSDSLTDDSIVKSDAADVKWVNGALTAPGDTYVIPNITTGKSGAPALAQASKQVSPGETAVIYGEGLSSANLRAYYTVGGVTKSAKFKVASDNEIAVSIDKNESYAAYGIYVENDKGASNIETVNMPDIWWHSFTDVNPGDEFSIYGENLTTKNGNTSNVYIVDGNRYAELKIISAAPNKVTVQIPNGLTDGNSYSVKLHNGHGGDYGWADVDKKITFRSHKINYGTGKVINVVDYGAKPNDAANNDSTAVEKAIADAKEGDTVYFPAGTYLFKTGITPDKPLKFKGDGADKTKFVTEKNTKNSLKTMFSLKFGSFEFSGIYFEEIATGSNKLKTTFIAFSEDAKLSGSYKLYVHDCKFRSESGKAGEWCQPVMVFTRASDIVVDNCRFDVTQAVWTDAAERFIFTNNDVCGNTWVGGYYDQNMFLIWNSYKMDFSNNYFYGKDLLTDETGTIMPGDQTIGRTFAFQGTNQDFYIGYNKLERVGLYSTNAGEQIMFEGEGNVYEGTASAVTKNTITLSKVPKKTVSSRMYALIVKGKGMGQYRKVKSANGKTVTLDRDWNIQPDSNSMIFICESFVNNVIYNNTIIGCKNWNDGKYSGCAVQVYSNTINCFIEKNTISEIGAVNITPLQNEKDNMSSGTFWIHIDDNKLTDAAGLNIALGWMTNSTKPDIPMHLALGLTARGNYFNRNKLSIFVGMSNTEYFKNVWNGPWIYGTLLENNTFENTIGSANIEISKHQGYTILRNNKIVGSKPLYNKTSIADPTVQIPDPILYND